MSKAESSQSSCAGEHSCLGTLTYSTNLILNACCVPVPVLGTRDKKRSRGYLEAILTFKLTVQRGRQHESAVREGSVESVVIQRSHVVAVEQGIE